MERSSKDLLESLLFKIPNIRCIYDMLELGTITSSEHPEYNNIINNFEKPNVILCIGVLTTCIIVQRTRKNEFRCLVIGRDVYYTKCKKSDLYNLIDDAMLIRDFIPQPLNKKLAFINDYNKSEIHGNVYTEMKTKLYVDRIVSNIVESVNIDDSELLDYYEIVKSEINNIEVRELSK